MRVPQIDPSVAGLAAPHVAAPVSATSVELGDPRIEAWARWQRIAAGRVVIRLRPDRVIWRDGVR